jgi:hypothetical protein
LPLNTLWSLVAEAVEVTLLVVLKMGPAEVQVVLELGLGFL